MWFVYIIECKDKSLYTGITNDIDRRFLQHQKGIGAKYTKSHPVKKYAYSEKFRSRSLALIREAEIKSWERKQKLLLISDAS